jgi:hypothetical protein
MALNLPLEIAIGSRFNFRTNKSHCSNPSQPINTIKNPYLVLNGILAAFWRYFLDNIDIILEVFIIIQTYLLDLKEYIINFFVIFFYTKKFAYEDKLEKPENLVF